MRTMMIAACAVALCASTAACDKEQQAPKPGAKDQGAAAKKAAPEKAEAPQKAAPDKQAEAAPAAAPDPKLLARGEFVASVAGCMLCHTSFGPQGPDMAKAWAGGLEIPEAFGTWRSPNITQDKKTGIGGWTDEQIDAAIRQGKRPDGSQMFPIMPYLFYNKMSDDDAKALVAYLRTIEPIEHAVAGNTDLKLPKIPAPKPEGKAPPDDDLAQGAYMATMMHCAACHTPMTEKGPDMARAFAGGMKLELPMLGEGEIYTANLTSDKKTGIGDWSDEQVAKAIKGVKRDGTPVLPPMALYSPVWSQLPDAEIAKIVKFLRTLPAIENAIPASTFKPKGPPPAAGE